jgi:hypothetical protein
MKAGAIVDSGEYIQLRDLDMGLTPEQISSIINPLNNPARDRLGDSVGFAA